MVDYSHDVLTEPERATMHVLIRRLLVSWEVWVLVFFVAVLVTSMNAIIYRSSQWSRIEQKVDQLHVDVRALATKEAVNRKDIRALEVEVK
jgi:hypothetical protein